ncbi:purine/pyrimidine permease [Pseudoneobacillus sp. C159]
MIKQNKFLSTFQWFIFLLVNSIALPIVIGNVFQLTSSEISELMQRMFFIVGLSSFIQAKFGHRFPLADGPAGSWVSIFVIYASIGQQQGLTMQNSLQILSGGIIIAGLLLLLLGMTKQVQRLLFLFTPIVTGIFLFILAVQLSVVFISGMMPKNSETGQIDLLSFLLALLVVVMIVLFITKGKSWLKSYAILIGIFWGWTVFLCFGKVNSTISNGGELLKLPSPFAWGFPEFNGGMMITVILFTLLLISNTIAAISAAGEVITTEKNIIREKLVTGTFVGGVSHLLAAIFSTIAVVPIPATAGFVKITKQYKIQPFLFACGILMIVSMFPGIVGFMASLPLPVASAVLLATLIDMFKISLRSMKKQALNSRTIIIIGISLLLGIGIMFEPNEMLNNLPNFIQFFVKNGLIMGTFVAILLEQLWKVKDHNNQAS